jgi:hypothetical protein
METEEINTSIATRIALFGTSIALIALLLFVGIMTQQGYEQPASGALAPLPPVPCAAPTPPVPDESQEVTAAELAQLEQQIAQLPQLAKDCERAAEAQEKAIQQSQSR